jgi:fucose permease
MALAGIANSSRYGTIVALPIELIPGKEVGAASGLILTFGFVGGAIGPYVGGHILDLTGSLEMSLLILAGMSAATAVIALKLPETGRLVSSANLKPGSPNHD